MKKKTTNIGATLKNGIGAVLFHLCIICSLVLISVQVLDWYNPYMNFGGHATWVKDLLCFAYLLFAAIKIISHEPERRKLA